MNRETAIALEKSIKHWEENVAAEKTREVRLGIAACALCGLYNKINTCDGCPVKKKTGLDGCEGTPYSWVCSTFSVWDNSKKETDRLLFTHAATAELNFLKSLRTFPEGFMTDEMLDIVEDEG